MRVVWILLMCVMLCSGVVEGEGIHHSYHDIQFRMPTELQGIPKSLLEDTSYKDRSGKVCGYDFGFSKTGNLDRPKVLVRFVSEKSNYMSSFVEASVDLRQLKKLEGDTLIFDRNKMLFVIRRTPAENDDRFRLLVAIPAEEGFVCFYFFFNESVSDEELLLIGTVVDGFVLNGHSISPSSRTPSSVKIVSVLVFFSCGLFSVWFFRKSREVQKRNRDTESSPRTPSF